MEDPPLMMKRADGTEIPRPWYHQIAEVKLLIPERRVESLIGWLHRMGFATPDSNDCATWNFGASGWRRWFNVNHADPLPADGLWFCNDAAPRPRTYSRGACGVQIEWGRRDERALVQIWRNKANPDPH